MPDEHIIVIEPVRKNHEENVELVKREMYHKGVSVIIERRECIQTAVVSIKLAKEAKAKEEAAKEENA